MIIQCDKCQSKFRLDESKVVGAGIKVKCTKCQNVFIVRPPGYQEPSATEQAQAAPPPPPPQPSVPPPPQQPSVPPPPAQPAAPKPPVNEFSFDAGTKSGVDFKFGEQAKPGTVKGAFDFSTGGSGEMDNSDISAMFQNAGAAAPAVGVPPSEWSIKTLSEVEAGGAQAAAKEEAEAKTAAAANEKVKEKQSEDFATNLEIEHNRARKEALLKKKENQRLLQLSEEGGPSTMKKLAVLFLALAAIYYTLNYSEINKEVEESKTYQQVKDIVIHKKPAEEPKKLVVSEITAFYVVNKKIGNIFVISANVNNPGNAPLTLKGAKGIIFGKSGVKLVEQASSPGRVFSGEEMKTLTAAELTRQPKDADKPVEIKPMTTLPLQFIFVKVPADMTEYGVDISQ